MMDQQLRRGEMDKLVTMLTGSGHNVELNQLIFLYYLKVHCITSRVLQFIFFE